MSTGLQNLIDGTVYINLSDRVDRKNTFLKEINKIHLPVERINAVKDHNGGLGCVKSQILALEYAKKREWKNVLIFEDDFIFSQNRLLVLYKLLTVLKKIKSWDVIMISGIVIESERTKYAMIERVLSAQSASGYIVNSYFYDKLLDIYYESEKNLELGKDYKVWALDQNWKKLQPDNNWYIFSYHIGHQQKGYSDIEKCVVDYTNLKIQ